MQRPMNPQMAYDPRAAYFHPVPNDCPYTLARPIVTPYVGPRLIQGRTFEVRPATINMVQQNQFAGKNHEDPHNHLRKFKITVDTVRLDDNSPDVVRAILFPHSLLGQAMEWYESQPEEVKNDWTQLVTSFLEEYFPQTKVDEYQQLIQTFKMKSDEEFWEAWNRYKKLVLKCPQHGFSSHLIAKYFYHGLPPAGQNMLCCRANLDLMQVLGEVAWDIIDDLAKKKVSWRGDQSTLGGMRFPTIKELIMRYTS